jgi:hypothetical protein
MSCDTISVMKYQLSAGQFAKDPDGNRLFVEAVGAAGQELPSMAICRHIEGEKKNVRVQWWAGSLEALGPEIPITKPD